MSENKPKDRGHEEIKITSEPHAVALRAAIIHYKAVGQLRAHGAAQCRMAQGIAEALSVILESPERRSYVASVQARIKYVVRPPLRQDEIAEIVEKVLWLTSQEFAREARRRAVVKDARNKRHRP